MMNDWIAKLAPYVNRLWIPIVEVIAGIIIGPYVKKLILKMSKKSLDKGAMTFLASCANVVIIASAFIIAAEQLGMKLNSIVSLISALGLGVSLALKGNMANVAGGLQILITKPFKVGDYIKINNHKGTVTTIELMFTTMRTDNGKEVVIPNNLLVTDMLTNYSRQPARRISIMFPVPVPADTRAIEKQALDIASRNEFLLKDPAPSITVQGFAEGYINMLLIGYVDWQNYEKCHYSICHEMAQNMDFYQPKKEDEPKQ